MNSKLIQTDLRKMADDGPPAKRARYSLRFANRTNDNTSLTEPDPHSLSASEKRQHSKWAELIDDCWLKVFEYLSPYHLGNIAQVNRKLSDAVKYYVRVKHKLQFHNRFAFETIDGTKVNFDVAHKFLYIFGRELESLTLSSDSFVIGTETDINKILPFVQKHCNSNLKELTIKHFGMTGLTMGFLRNLESLTLINCSVTREWCHMKKLKTLNLHKLIFRAWPMVYEYDSDDETDDDDYYDHFRHRTPIDIPVDHFGALEELRLSDTKMGDFSVARLIKLNSGLKKLSVIKSRAVTTHFFDALVGLNQLEEFEFKKCADQEVLSRELNPLMTLKDLKTLKFCYNNYSTQQLIEGLLENGIVLEHLELSIANEITSLVTFNASLFNFLLGTGQFDYQTAETIVKMTSIKVLKLNEMSGLNQSHLVIIAQGFIHLEELHVKLLAEISSNGIRVIVHSASRLTRFKLDGSVKTLDRQTYRTILAAIQARAEPSALKMTVYGNGRRVFIPKELLNDEDAKWFSVDEVGRRENKLFEDLVSELQLGPKARYLCYKK